LIQTPNITIVIATYNRSEALRNAIRCVRAQTYSNWEMIIVGDACTDDSPEVVSSFHDQRLHWFNLPERFGEQAGPNSVGMTLARTELIAFLNQDDLWLPHHLSSACKALAATGADIFWARPAFFTNRGARSDAAIFSQQHPAVRSLETACNGPFYYSEPMSSWVMQSRIVKQVGTMRLASECIAYPIVDYVFRLWTKGCTLISGPDISVLADRVSGLAVDRADARPVYSLSVGYAERWVRLIENGGVNELLSEINDDIWLSRQLGLSNIDDFTKYDGPSSRTSVYRKSGIDILTASASAARVEGSTNRLLDTKLAERTGNILKMQPSLEHAIATARQQSNFPPHVGL
jgi:hypothetical protein